MKQYITLLLLLLLPVLGYSQNQYGAGLYYTEGTPTVVIDTTIKGARVAYDIINNVFYTHDASTGNWSQLTSGGGDVATVNGQSGTVVLDADDIGDAATTKKFATQAQLDKLTAIESNATSDQTGTEIVSAIDTELGQTTWKTGSQNGYDEVEVILFIGESNSGGQARNSDLSAGELEPSPQVQIWNTLAQEFQDLDIGTNNSIGHSGLDSGVEHGWENGLAKEVEAGVYGIDTIFLLKAGQGGSRIAQWGPTSAYTDTFERRVSELTEVLLLEGKKPKWTVWMSFGINDALFPTDSSTFVTNTIAWVDRIRTTLRQPAPIIWTEMPPSYDTYDTYIDAVVAAREYQFKIESRNLPLDDINHWDATGMDTIAQRMGVITRDSTYMHPTWPYFHTESSAGGGTVDSTRLAGTQKNELVYYSGGSELYRDTILMDYLSVSGSGGSSVDTVVWGTVTGTATDLGGGSASFASDVSTALANQTIDPTQDFYVEYSITNTSTNQQISFNLDDENTNLDGWGSSSDFRVGVFTIGTTIYRANSTVVTTFAAPAKIRLTKSGNDVLLQLSESGGAFSTEHTFTNALLGAPNPLYLKADAVVNNPRTLENAVIGDPSAGGGGSSHTREILLAGQKIFWGEDTPESSVTATVGAMYLRTNGVADSVLYVKETGTGTTGWKPVSTSSIESFSFTGDTGTASTITDGGSVTISGGNLIATTSDGSGGVQLDVASAVPTVLEATLIGHDTPSIAAGDTYEFSITVTGATNTDHALANPTNLPAGLMYSTWVSADTVNVRLHNTTGVAIDPAVATWTAKVIQ